MPLLINRLGMEFLEGTVSTGKTVADLGFGYGFRVVIVGMLVVFFVLALLWGVLSVSRIFFYDVPKKKKERRNAAAVQASDVPVPIASTPETADDATLIAVITAALAAAMDAEGTTPAGGFRVVSFRRTGNGQWNR